MPVFNSTIQISTKSPIKTPTSTIPTNTSKKVSKTKSIIKTKVPTLNTFTDLPPTSTETINIVPEIGKEIVKQIDNLSFTPTQQIIIGACAGLVFLIAIVALCIKGHSRPTRLPRGNYPTSVLKSPTRIPLSPSGNAEMRERMRARDEESDSE